MGAGGRHHGAAGRGARGALCRAGGPRIGLSFTEVDDLSEAELRIGFQSGGGSWSVVGKEALLAGLHQRTVNFGWDLTEPGERGTALHQIGHALGMLHEHQSPCAGLHWDDEAAAT
ncbi:hypothetical protein SHIRM173S_02410 [Streptomyces hirsutus]